VTGPASSAAPGRSADHETRTQQTSLGEDPEADPRALASVVAVSAFVLFLVILLLLALREIVGGLARLPQLAETRCRRARAPTLERLPRGRPGAPRAALRPGPEPSRARPRLRRFRTVRRASSSPRWWRCSAWPRCSRLLTRRRAPGSGRGIVGLFSPDRRPAAEAAGSEALRVTGAWFYASTLTSLVDASGIGLGLWLLDVPLVVPILRPSHWATSRWSGPRSQELWRSWSRSPPADSAPRWASSSW
jgi:hypothetical protein